MNTFSLLLLATFSATAQGPCDPSVPPQGRCDGARRVIWCEYGESHALECTGGAVCAWNEAIALFDCVSASCDRDVDDDGDIDSIPPTGRCVGDRVVWCEAGQPHELECKGGTSCGWNDKLGAHDCMTDAMYAEPRDVEDDDDAVSGSSPDASADAGVIPQGSGDAAVKPVSYADTASSGDTVATPAQSAGCGVTSEASRLSIGVVAAALLGALFACRRAARRSFR